MENFNLQLLEKLLQAFYNLTNIKICLYDFEGNELCYYPTRLSSFCKILRENKEIDQRCKDCDRLAFERCKKTRSQYVYTCHAGLKECVSPIICDNHIIGFIMIGQIKSSSDTDFVRFQEKLPENIKTKLRLDYNSLPSISDQKLLDALQILDACAGYETLKTLLQVHKKTIDAQIDQFIRSHLASSLSVSLLCSEFHLSRHELYHICKEYFDCTPAEYIKKCRLIYASELLSATDLPINKIAMQSGIPDYNYFSKVFKSMYGTSPTKYRKSQKKDG